MSRRLAVLASLLAVLLGSVAGPVQAEAAFIPKAVTIKADHDAKTITATVNLAFYNRSCGRGLSCELPAEDVARIVKAIETMWNNGSKVRCYEFKVDVKARSVGSQSESGQTEVDIGLDYGPVPVRAFVHGAKHGSGASDHLSNAPDQRVEAAHDPAGPTTWPSNTYDQTYAHEFGHILGLDDNYDTNRPGFPLPGASDDLMFRKQGTVTDEMVKRVVERSGQVDLKDLRCGWTTNADTQFGQIRGTKCEEIGGEWTVTGEERIGQVVATSLWNVTIDAAALAGTYRFERIQVFEEANSVTTANSKGNARIVVNQDGTVMMTVDPAPLTIKITAAGIPSTTVTMPGDGRTFLWEVAAAGACP